MFARFQTGRHSEHWNGQPAFAGGYVLRRIGDGRGLAVSLWDGDGGGYEILADVSKGTKTPEIVSVMSYEGPLSKLLMDAAAVEWRERIEPTMAGHAEFVRALALWDPVSRGRLVLTMCTSVDGLDSLRHAIDSVPIKTDPALLPGPDRVELYAAESRILPADGRSLGGRGHDTPYRWSVTLDGSVRAVGGHL
jgi:hypothetical protein